MVYPLNPLKTSRIAFQLLLLVVVSLFTRTTGFSQLAPGPIEILPFEEAFIFEAWYDLNRATSGTNNRADWTGYAGNSWRSPNAYSNHTGSDFALQTGTPILAVADGEVIALETSIPENSGGGYGNYVRLRLDEPSPEGNVVEVITAHMLPNVVVNVGQRVATGQLIGYSDNTGNSTSEHSHLETLISDSTLCPFYHGLFKYPVMLTENGSVQVGHLVKVKEQTADIRLTYSDSSTLLGTASQDQVYFSSGWQHGHYRIFLPNDSTNRSGWIRAIDIEEIFEGTVIQTVPDSGSYSHTAHLVNTYAVYQERDVSSQQIGTLYFGGGRFVATEVVGDWYRVAVPSGEQWGWVRADNRMIVYPEVVNPGANINYQTGNDFPISENFAKLGRSTFGRSKFNRGEVKEFSPSAPDGDGKALFLTDATNSGDGKVESIIVGRAWHRDYSVQCDVYFHYQPSLGGYNRYGVFMRDDGFAGLDQTFEGPGNGYMMLFDSDDGRLRCGKMVEASLVDFRESNRIYMPETGWHTMKIQAAGDLISYYLDGELLIEEIDTSFVSGPCGVGYSNKTSSWPLDRGAYFDHFSAKVNVRDTWLLY